MKILQISPVAPPQRSGMANAAGEIYKATKNAGADVELVAAFGDSTIKNLHHYRIPGAGFLAFTPGIVGFCKKYDLVHLHYPCYGNALMVALSRMFGCKKPLIISYHMDTVGRGLRKPVFAFHAKYLAHYLLRQASAIVVASRDYAEHSLLTKYPDLMAKVVEIPFGVDSERFHPADIQTPRPQGGEGRVGDPAQGGVRGSVLFTAALDEQHYFKGLHILLEAMVEAPDASLTVVGDGNLKESYIRKAKELKIDDRVIFAGRVSDADLPKYFQDADLFCSASVDRSEAYGIVLMEAAAAGLPAVASDIPGVRSVVQDGETGLLIPPNDSGALAEALRDMLGNPELLAKMSQAARAFALTRNWADAGKKYLEIYRKVLDHAAASPEQ